MQAARASTTVTTLASQFFGSAYDTLQKNRNLKEARDRHRAKSVRRAARNWLAGGTGQNEGRRRRCSSAVARSSVKDIGWGEIFQVEKERRSRCSQV